MRGRIVSQNDVQIELLDRWGNTRILHKRPHGLYIGENGRLYTRVASGRDGHREPRDQEVEFLSLGRAATADIKEYHIEKDQRTVKDRMAGDLLRYLRNDRGMSYREIGRKYDVSDQYISRLTRDYGIR